MSFKKCYVCEQSYLLEDIHADKVCDVCFLKMQNLHNSILYGSESLKPVMVNSFVASIFTEEEVNKILLEKLSDEFEHQHRSGYYCLRNYFQEVDESNFIEFVLNQRSKENGKS